MRFILATLILLVTSGAHANDLQQQIQAVGQAHEDQRAVERKEEAKARAAEQAEQARQRAIADQKAAEQRAYQQKMRELDLEERDLSLEMKRARAKRADKFVDKELDKADAENDAIRADSEATRNVSEGARDMMKGVGENGIFGSNKKK